MSDYQTCMTYLTTDPPGATGDAYCREPVQRDPYRGRLVHLDQELDNHHRPDPFRRPAMDYTPTPIATPEPVTDAQMAARWAAEAFQDGRFALGEAIGRIALKAHIADQHASITQLQISPAVPTPHFDAVAGDRSFFGEGDENARPLTPPETTRCVGTTTKDGVRVPCEAGIYKITNEGGWWAQHVDTSLDEDHAALWPHERKG